jgi:hypothetical protein
MAHFIGRSRWDEIATAIIDHARRHGTRRAA